MINIVIVTHGEFGAYMVEAAESIVGRQGDGIAVVSISARMSVDEVRRRVEIAVKDLKCAEGLIVATDIPGGTPSNIALPCCKDQSNVAVVSGLNLYMLITAFTHRKTMGLQDLTLKMINDGQRSIRDIKAVLLSKVH